MKVTRCGKRQVCSLALCASNAASLSFFYRAVLRIILKHSLLSVLPNSDKVHMSKARLGLCRILTTARDCAGATDDDGSPVSIQHSSSSVRQSGQYGGLTLQAQTELAQRPAHLCFAASHRFSGFLPTDSLSSAVAMAEKVFCNLCRVKLSTPTPAISKRRTNTQHVTFHLIPVDLHESLIKSGLYSRVQCDITVPACYPCTEAASRYFTDKERARYLPTLRQLHQALKGVGWFE